jgi:hypothetical protein
MANEEHVALLKQGVAVWNAWRRNSDISPDPEGRSLRPQLPRRRRPQRCGPHRRERSQPAGHGPAFSRRWWC